MPIDGIRSVDQGTNITSLLKNKIGTQEAKRTVGENSQTTGGTRPAASGYGYNPNNIQMNNDFGTPIAENNINPKNINSVEDAQRALGWKQSEEAQLEKAAQMNQEKQKQNNEQLAKINENISQKQKEAMGHTVEKSKYLNEETTNRAEGEELEKQANELEPKAQNMIKEGKETKSKGEAEEREATSELNKAKQQSSKSNGKNKSDNDNAVNNANTKLKNARDMKKKGADMEANGNNMLRQSKDYKAEAEKKKKAAEEAKKKAEEAEQKQKKANEETKKLREQLEQSKLTGRELEEQAKKIKDRIDKNKKEIEELKKRIEELKSKPKDQNKSPSGPSPKTPFGNLQGPAPLSKMMDNTPIDQATKDKYKNVMNQIESNQQLKSQFESLSPAEQKRFLELTISDQASQGMKQFADSLNHSLLSILYQGKMLAKDNAGDTLLDNLTVARNQKYASGVNNARAFEELVKDIAKPDRIWQGSRNTCTAAAFQYLNAKMHPAEYARILRGLLSEQGRVQLRTGQMAYRNAGTLGNDGSGRSLTERVYQAFGMELGNGSKWYDARTDSNNGGAGMDGWEVNRLTNAVMPYNSKVYFGNDGKAISRMYAALQKGYQFPVGLYWGSGGHELIVEGMDKNYVYLRNPHGHAAGNAGHQRMDIRTFASRIIDYQIPIF